MPGLYIQDGGETSSAIGNILGGIAQQVGPEGAAKAALLQQQTQGADLDNQAKWNALVAGQNLDIPGLTRTLNMNATDPGNPSVAGTVTSLAVPPSSVRGPGGRLATIPDESGYTPEQKYLLNEAINGRLGSDALGKDVDTFSTPLVGAGGTPGAIRTRATTPLSPGQVINTTGQPGGPTISGGSVYDQGVAETESHSNPPSAEHDVNQGAEANANLGKATNVLNLYDKLIAPESTPGGILTEALAQNAADYLHLPVAQILQMGVPGVKKEIRQQFASMVASLRDNQGQPMFKGGLSQILEQFPDPDTDAPRFRSAMATLATTLQQQVADGQAAMDWYKHPSQEGYVQLLQRKAQNAAAARDAFANVGLNTEATAAPAPAPAPRPGPAKFTLVPDVDTGMKLPSGSLFRTPDGKTYKVP